MSDTTVAALFLNTDAAERARRSVSESGIPTRNVRVFRPRSLHERPHARAIARTMIIGTVLGVVIGAVLGHFAGIAASPYGSVTQNGGSIVPVMLLAVTGAAAGGTIGGMIAMSVTSDPALYLAQEVDAGRALVSVTVETDRVPAAATLLRRAGSFDVVDTNGDEARRLAEQ